MSCWVKCDAPEKLLAPRRAGVKERGTKSENGWESHDIQRTPEELESALLIFLRGAGQMGCEPSDKGIVTNQVCQVPEKLNLLPEHLLWHTDSQVAQMAGHGTRLHIREA